MDYSSSTFFKTLFQQISNGGTVLTPNRRLAAHLRKIYAGEEKKKGHKVWPSPDILPISSWFTRTWQTINQQSFAKLPHLLSSFQEKYLWEQILTQSSQHHLLLQTTETAELIQSAHVLLTGWQVTLDHNQLASPDYIALNHWLEDFKRICHEQDWLDQARLPDAILQQLEIISRQLPNKIILYGFNELTPLYQYFFDVYASFGCTVLNLQPQLTNKQTYRIACPTADDEIYLAARYAKEKFQKDPTAQIGIVFLNLEQQRDRIKQVFTEVFHETSAFNISAGKSLHLYPIIHAAMQLLSMHQGNFTPDMVGFLLSTPFLGYAEQERFQRARFDEILRSKNISNLNFLATAQHNNWQKYVPKLTQQLNTFFDIIKQLPTKQSFTQWCNTFHELLMAFGWPGERSLISDEYQTVENWLSLFAEIGSLDYVDQSVTYTQAWQALYKITRSRKFQPQSPETSIQILGALEAAALPFDYLWVTGMTDIAWPPSPNPHPFIPKSLQRQLHMPHATANREFVYCQDITKQFQNCASEMICSYHERQDEMECAQSSLISNLPEIFEEQLLLPPYQPTMELLFASRVLETIIDTHGPALSTDEIVHGGASVLKHQAMCAFKAFAEWRLHAHELEESLYGLRAKDRGALVHRALQLIWTNLDNHDKLINADEASLLKLITTSVEQTLSEKLHYYEFRPQYIGLEKQRLIKLLTAWLNFEKQRTPFRVIQQEQKAEIQISQLKLAMRIDRVDELESGQKLIIDYKTGKSNEIRQWFSDRPDEPQLPLYALIAPEVIAGISYAQVAPGDHGFKGVGRDEISMQGIKSLAEVKHAQTRTWEEQIKNWQSILTSLATDFIQGEASVNPKDAQTCIYCQLKPLCRIFEDETYVT